MRNKDRKIEVTHYVPASPKASIQIFHGMAEHKDRYRELLTYLALNDIHCVIYNQRGHGPDEKKKNSVILILLKIFYQMLRSSFALCQLIFLASVWDTPWDLLS